MLKQGPIPRFVHGALEYLVAALLIAAPFLLSFTGVGAATAAAIVLGIVFLFLAATTQGATSLINSVPVAAHVVFDYVLAAALIAAPFVLGFSGKTTPTAFFIVLGVVHLLITIGTRFEREPRARRRRKGRKEPPEVLGEADPPAASTPSATAEDDFAWESVSRRRPSREG
jgi:FtsH-binding integral membrane protein